MTKNEIINSDWYVPRDCPFEGDCDSHGCGDCLHEDSGYPGCDYCSAGVLCCWVKGTQEAQ